YNVPGRTGLSFTAETYQVLAQIPNINGVKEASGSLTLFAHTKALCPADFSVWSGNDDQIVPLMSLGALGVISVAANVIPAEM
ncbi:MAG: dihydrodipicolinate synthase family protein, partial [Oscillospiraceae bacterium]